jgi:RHS repeat-associated protein
VLGPDEGNPLQYTGRENDGTGLYYYRARYYDPGLKRFVSEDPIGTQVVAHLYQYADGAPAMANDPSGMLSTAACANPANAAACAAAGIAVRGRPLPIPIPIPKEREDNCDCIKKFEECIDKGLDRPRAGGSGICTQCLRRCQAQGSWPPTIEISDGGSLNLYVRCE